MERLDSGNLQATTKELFDASEMRWSVCRGRANNIPRSLLCNYHIIKNVRLFLHNLLHTIICDEKSRTQALRLIMTHSMRTFDPKFKIITFLFKTFQPSFWFTVIMQTSLSFHDKISLTSRNTQSWNRISTNHYWITNAFDKDNRRSPREIKVPTQVKRLLGSSHT